MKKYRVTLYLMVDPQKGDDVFAQIYNVEAESEREAYNKAEEMQSQDAEQIRHRSIFDFNVKEIK